MEQFIKLEKLFLLQLIGEEVNSATPEKEYYHDREESGVPMYFVPTGCTDLSDSVGGAVSTQTGLQRIVSRCRCDFYYLYYDEEELPDDRIKRSFDKDEEEEKATSALFEVTRNLLLIFLIVC